MNYDPPWGFDNSDKSQKINRSNFPADERTSKTDDESSQTSKSHSHPFSTVRAHWIKSRETSSAARDYTGEIPPAKHYKTQWKWFRKLGYFIDLKRNAECSPFLRSCFSQKKSDLVGFLWRLWRRRNRNNVSRFSNICTGLNLVNVVRERGQIVNNK